MFSHLQEIYDYLVDSTTPVAALEELALELMISIQDKDDSSPFEVINICLQQHQVVVEFSNGKAFGIQGTLLSPTIYPLGNVTKRRFNLELGAFLVALGTVMLEEDGQVGLHQMRGVDKEVYIPKLLEALQNNAQVQQLNLDLSAISSIELAPLFSI